MKFPSLVVFVALFGAIASAVGCSDDPPAATDPPTTTAADTTPTDANVADANVADAKIPDDALTLDTTLADGALTLDSGADAGGDTHDDATSYPPFSPGTTPKKRLWPVAGELTIVQVGMDSFIPKMGESAVVVGPDGTIALIDVGNDKHAEQVRELVETLNTQHLTVANGFAARTKRQVEWIVLTHWHADHVGGLKSLLDGDDKLDIKGGVVHRGWVDVGDAVNEKHWESACTLLRGKLSALDKPLCAPQTLPSCDLSANKGHHPATQCDGLNATWSLGAAAGDNPAKLVFLAADAWLATTPATPAPKIGYDDSNQENARSLVGLIELGAFRYHFGGDLTGAGTVDEPDIETSLAAKVGPKRWHKHGVDVAHAHHHARKTSNNKALIAALSPKDGKSRNVVAGVSKLHVGSPQDEVGAAWTSGARLAKGKFWTTFTTFTSAKPKDFPSLVDADGDVVLRTVQGGVGYWMQAPKTEVAAAFASVRTLPN